MANWGDIFLTSYWGFSDEDGFGSIYYEYDEVTEIGVLAENGDNIVTEENDFTITG